MCKEMVCIFEVIQYKWHSGQKASGIELVHEGAWADTGSYKSCSEETYPNSILVSRQSFSYCPKPITKTNKKIYQIPQHKGNKGVEWTVKE